MPWRLAPLAHGSADEDAPEQRVAVPSAATTYQQPTYSSGGTGNFGYLAIMGREGGEIVQEAIGLVGDRVQIRVACIDEEAVVLDVLQAGPGDGMCCPRQLATRKFGIQSGKLVQTDMQVTGTASPSTLAGTKWVLRKLDGQEGEALPGQTTLAFASGRVSGSTGCNQFQGAVSEGESATSLVIGPLTTTRMACPEPLMAQENTFLEKLGQAEVFQFLVGDLVLSGASGALVFSSLVD